MEEWMDNQEPPDWFVVGSDTAPVIEHDKRLACLMANPRLTFHERLIFILMLGEAGIERVRPLFEEYEIDALVYPYSLKRLCLMTGWSADNIQYAVGRLTSEGFLEPVDPRGYRMHFVGTLAD
jgi:hypothetical protein